MIDTLPCESCGNVTRVWGYDDCQTCLDKMQQCQQDGLLDYDFSDPAIDLHEDDVEKAQAIILVLMRMFEHRVSSRRDLRDATQMFYQLEGLHINHSSDAWGEVERLKRIWKTRLRAQDGIDHWCTSHGYAAY